MSTWCDGGCAVLRRQSQTGCLDAGDPPCRQPTQLVLAYALQQRSRKGGRQQVGASGSRILETGEICRGLGLEDPAHHASAPDGTGRSRRCCGPGRPASRRRCATTPGAGCSRRAVGPGWRMSRCRAPEAFRRSPRSPTSRPAGLLYPPGQFGGRDVGRCGMPRVNQDEASRRAQPQSPARPASAPTWRHCRSAALMRTKRE